MSEEPSADDILVAVADLGEHLSHAREVLHLPPFGPDRPAEGDGPRVVRVLDVAQTAVATLAAFAQGLRRSFKSGAVIELHRDGNRVIVRALGAPSPGEIAAFIEELHTLDQRLLDAAALLGFLLHLCTGWVSAGFAAPLLFKTLAEHGPHILELGAALIAPRSDPQSQAPS